MKHKRVVALLMAGVMVLSHGVMPIADEWVDAEEELVGNDTDFEEPAEEFFEDDQIVVDDQWDETGTDDVLMDESADDSVMDDALFYDEPLEVSTETDQQMNDAFEVDEKIEEITETAELQEASILSSGQCGDNVNWTLDSDGNLTISGTGDILPARRTVHQPGGSL